MSVYRNLLLAGLVCAAMCVTAAAAAKRQSDAWTYYRFDGHDFVAGQPTDGSAFVAIRNHALPVVVTNTTNIAAVSMPPGKGAIAGICYIQSSGGKLASGPGYAPYPRIPVQIYSGDRIFATLSTNDQGYFVTALAAGRYVVSSGAVKVEVTVEKDNTVLIPLRAGKRMVD